MNTRSLITTGMVCASALTIASLIANAGPLTPPVGPIAETGRFGPRTEINATNTPGDNDLITPSLFKITQPGSYYLAGNITGVSGKFGIEIDSSGVTLDLMGFDLSGVAGSRDGISVTNFSGAVVNVHIHSGSVRGWGGDGVNTSAASNTSLRNLLAANNAGTGLHIGQRGLIEGCAAQSNGNHGIRSLAGSIVSGNTASGNSTNGISTGGGCTVSGNTALGNTGDGISTGTDCTVSGNTTTSNTGNGILVGNGCTVSGNTASSNRGDGIHVFDDCLVFNNTCHNNGFGVSDGAGIHALVSNNRIEDNIVTRNDRGIDVDAIGNLILRNGASNNTVNYAIASGNVGIYVVGTATGAVNGSSGGTTVGTTNPWANFSY